MIFHGNFQKARPGSSKCAGFQNSQDFEWIATLAMFEISSPVFAGKAPPLRAANDKK